MKRHLICAALATAAAAATAQELDPSLYRADQPEVLQHAQAGKKANQQSEQAVIEAFKSVYIKAGRPKIVMFWHRDLSDEISSSQEATATEHSSGAMPWDNYDRVIKIESKSGAEKQVLLTPSARTAEFESGLHKTLFKGGVSFVDRNTVIRLVGLDKAGNGQKTKDLDYQTVEMESIARFAQYIAEVNFVRDPQSKGGFEPRITVISTSTGEIVADVVPGELYKLDQDPGRWVTTENGVVRQSVEGDGAWTIGENGFQKKARKVTSIEDGHRVAVALMQQLTETLPADMPKKNVSP